MMSRVPDVPTGCPSAIAPPFTLSRSEIEFADGLIAIEFAMGKVARSHCLTTGQDLSSECLVDLDEFKVRHPQAGLLKEFVDGEHGSETHAPRIAAGQCVGTNIAERFATREFVGASEHRGGRPIGDLAAIAGGNGPILPIEDRLQLGQRFERLIRRGGRHPC